MKTRFIILIVFVVFCWIFVNAEGKHNGWPNKGINSPGNPNHYASPNPIEHP